MSSLSSNYLCGIVRNHKHRSYDHVEDEEDAGPLYNEEDFQKGIRFSAKYIGTLDINRPRSRSDIVASMRRIRYEFKAKNIKKKKITLTVLTDGLKVVLRKKAKKGQFAWDENHLVMLQHPIYRVFYVSHDSQDLKIFAYIARDPYSNIFKCNVFKSYKKSQAVKIVRTIGMAFEVSHRITKKDKDDEENKGEESKSVGASFEDVKPPLNDSESDLGVLFDAGSRELAGSMSDGALTTPIGVPLQDDTDTPLTTSYQIQICKAQMALQEQQIQNSLAECQLLKDQLEVEKTARIESQTRNKRVLSQNKALIAQMSKLMTQLRDLESKNIFLSSDNPGKHSIVSSLETSGLPPHVQPVDASGLHHIDSEIQLSGELLRSNGAFPNSSGVSVVPALRQSLHTRVAHGLRPDEKSQLALSDATSSENISVPRRSLPPRGRSQDMASVLIPPPPSITDKKLERSLRGSNVAPPFDLYTTDTLLISESSDVTTPICVSGTCVTAQAVSVDETNTASFVSYCQSPRSSFSVSWNQDCLLQSTTTSSYPLSGITSTTPTARPITAV